MGGRKIGAACAWRREAKRSVEGQPRTWHHELRSSAFLTLWDNNNFSLLKALRPGCSVIRDQNALTDAGLNIQTTSDKRIIRTGLPDKTEDIQ